MPIRVLTPDYVNGIFKGLKIADAKPSGAPSNPCTRTLARSFAMSPVETRYPASLYH